ncbi:SDR family oxidoreductase [Conexibacter sp. CPCC 206217]|uniref:SDR family oxidoreductase n=1 Tax=Conexibacter sp. CPCC 206217 TaxID=3064574 RepID=UPI002727F607|nr:SDR family oxidoreductase [Conexibacter sp. CPCC 206217]MDO8213284.1 SDR family oxidoreductase [Conexibacter sp. CPCC 206217]
MRRRRSSSAAGTGGEADPYVSDRDAVDAAVAAVVTRHRRVDKGALIAFAKSLAAEVSDDRVRVNTVFPGVIVTPQLQAANPTGGEREHWQKTTGIGTPEDVVGPLLFLLFDAATMTGSTLARDRAFGSEEESPSGARMADSG